MTRFMEKKDPLEEKIEENFIKNNIKKCPDCSNNKDFHLDFSWIKSTYFEIINGKAKITHKGDRDLLPICLICSKCFRNITDNISF